MNWLEILKRAKKEQGKTNDDISIESGISKSTIEKFFAGYTKDPQLSTVRKIAYTLGLTLDDLDDGPRFEKIDPSEQSHLKKYRSVDDHGRRAIDMITEHEYNRCMDAAAGK